MTEEPQNSSGIPSQLCVTDERDLAPAPHLTAINFAAGRLDRLDASCIARDKTEREVNPGKITQP